MSQTFYNDIKILIVICLSFQNSLQEFYEYTQEQCPLLRSGAT